MIEGIQRVAKHTTIGTSDPIALLIAKPDNLYSVQIYSYPALAEQFEFELSFKPELFEVIDSNLFISGQDATGAFILYQHSVSRDTLLAQYELNASFSNAQEMLEIGGKIYVLSSPGGSTILLNELDLLDGAMAETVISAVSGARATNNEFQSAPYFTFQFAQDDESNFLNKQILLLDPVAGKLDTLLLDIEFDYFKYPKEEQRSFGSVDLGWIGAKWEENTSDTVYLAAGFEDIAKIAVNGEASFINATYGCWVNTVDQERENIKFQFSPNPASSEVTIDLKGLVKGQKYKLTILDATGKTHYLTTLSAYERLVIPLENLSNGIYFINLDTGRNLITQKLVIQ